jgi:glutathione S-transferase
MILIGQYDSPFVRRVGIALTIYEIPFDHRPWSTFGDAEKIRPYNPLTRVPTLVLDNGDVLIESQSIIDYLDRLVGPDRAMFPISEPTRHQALKIASLAIGLGDKAASLFYETKFHREVSHVWVNRCQSQILATLAVLEESRADRPGDYWFGNRIGHADIAVAVVLRFITEAHPELVSLANFPALRTNATRLEAMPAFQTITQPFIPPS